MSYYSMHSGQKIYIDNFTVDDVNLKDIAHHLTKVQRFGGSLPLGVHYSVAQHSIRLAEYALFVMGDLELAKIMLMHDASEAYLGDVVSTLKHKLEDYKAIETYVQNTILNKYGINTNFNVEAKYLDTRILLNEVQTFMCHKLAIFKDILPEELKPLDFIRLKSELGEEVNTYNEFLRWCDQLGIKD